MKSALITGAAGQDGTILATLLRRQGVDVIGVVKPGTSTSHLTQYAPGIVIVECDLSDVDSVRDTVAQARPDEIYNLGGISSIVESQENPELTHRTNVDAVRAILPPRSASSTCRSRRWPSAQRRRTSRRDRGP